MIFLFFFLFNFTLQFATWYHDLREAVFLSDTVYVMSSRPSSIIYKVKIELPRPRTLDMELSDDFNHYFSNIRRHIQH